MDFSGAAETGGRVSKLWVASCNQSSIQLSQGLTRSQLARKIAESPGLWVIDFPFGIPDSLGAALGLADHATYLQWASAGTPTARRDLARDAAGKAGLSWSSRRQIDLHIEATWFPLFEQLYRQTLTGAAEVLGGVRTLSPSARLLPFDDASDPEAVPHLIEGFPGFTIRSLGLLASGYKNNSDSARQRRSEILSALVGQGLPIPEESWQLALDDVDGDAVDALVLLLAASRSARRIDLMPPPESRQTRRLEWDVPDD